MCLHSYSGLGDLCWILEAEEIDQRECSGEKPLGYWVWEEVQAAAVYWETWRKIARYDGKHTKVGRCGVGSPWLCSRLVG